MKLELYIEGKKKIFTTPFVPMAAKRKYLEIMANAEERESEPTSREQLDEDDEIYSILADIAFKNQFTLEQLYEGNDQKYIEEKLLEVIHGIKPNDELKKKVDDGGNMKGE